MKTGVTDQLYQNATVHNIIKMGHICQNYCKGTVEVVPFLAHKYIALHLFLAKVIHTSHNLQKLNRNTANSIVHISSRCNLKRVSFRPFLKKNKMCSDRSVPDLKTDLKMKMHMHNNY